MKDAYFHARVTDNGIETHGTPSCALGTPVGDEADGKRQGVFLEWHWDGRRLTVRNDRYGYYPALYFERPGEICISPNLFRLLAEGAPTEYDYPALSVFLRFGYFLGEDTPFKRIRALPPNACLEWTEGRTSLSWSLPENRIEPISREDALARIVGLRERAVRRQRPTTDNVAVPLSGGRDSRGLLAELCRLGHRPRYTITCRRYPNQPDQDVEVAPLVARALDLPHVILDQSASAFQTTLRNTLETNLCADEHGWLLVMADFLREREVETVYDGSAGEILFHCINHTPGRLRLIRAGRLSEMAAILIKPRSARAVMADAAIRSLFSPEEAEQLDQDAAVARIADDLKRHAQSPHPIRSFKFWNRHRREISLAPFGLLSDVPKVFVPYLDHDLFDFLDSLPLALIRDEPLRDDSITRAFPEYAHIPFEAKYGGAPSPADVVRRHNARFARELAWAVLTRKRTPWTRSGRLTRRMMACLLSRRYAASTYWFASKCAYLLQLEAAALGRIPPP